MDPDAHLSAFPRKRTRVAAEENICRFSALRNGIKARSAQVAYDHFGATVHPREAALAGALRDRFSDCCTLLYCCGASGQVL